VASDAGLLRQQVALDLQAKAVKRMAQHALYTAWAAWHEHARQMRAVARLRQRLDRKLLAGGGLRGGGLARRRGREWLCS
jgi:hypothetical protein